MRSKVAHFTSPQVQAASKIPHKSRTAWPVNSRSLKLSIFSNPPTRNHRSQTQQQQVIRLRELESKSRAETDRLRAELADAQAQLRAKREQARGLAEEVEDVRSKMAELNRASSRLGMLAALACGVTF